MAIQRRLRRLAAVVAALGAAAAVVSVVGHQTRPRRPRQPRRRRHRPVYQYRRRTYSLRRLNDAAVRHLFRFSKEEI
jgi:hypothetical protein